MGIVRIDNELQKEIIEFIKKKENKYHYPSISAFINLAVYEKLKQEKNAKR